MLFLSILSKHCSIMTLLLWYFASIIIQSVAIGFSDGFRIIGGKEARLGEFPYQVSIRTAYNDAHICGGSIVSKNHIITAAHCVHYKWGGIFPPNFIKIVVAQINIPITKNTVYRNASDIFVHPQYNKETFANDIAIIEIDIDFDFSDLLVQPIPLQDGRVPAHTVCVVSGWGITNESASEISAVLLKANVNLFDNDQCDLLYRDVVSLSKGLICAGHSLGETDACQGDSGGPLVCEGSLTGIVSAGRGCGNKDYPGLYTEISFFTTWIEEIMDDFPYYMDSEENEFSERPIKKPLTTDPPPIMSDNDSSPNNGVLKLGYLDSNILLLTNALSMFYIKYNHYLTNN